MRHEFTVTKVLHTSFAHLSMKVLHKVLHEVFSSGSTEVISSDCTVVISSIFVEVISLIYKEVISAYFKVLTVTYKNKQWSDGRCVTGI